MGRGASRAQTACIQRGSELLSRAGSGRRLVGRWRYGAEFGGALLHPERDGVAVADLMSEWKFVHAADIHLDAPLVGLERYDGAPVEEIRGASRRALHNVVDVCLEEQA